MVTWRLCEHVLYLWPTPCSLTHHLGLSLNKGSPGGGIPYTRAGHCSGRHTGITQFPKNFKVLGHKNKLDPPCQRAEECVTWRERVYRPPSILHRQLHDLGEPMVPAGIHIFPNLDHVLHKELALGGAPGRRRSRRSELPLQVPGDDTRHQGFRPPAAVLPPRHELQRPVRQG